MAKTFVHQPTHRDEVLEKPQTESQNYATCFTYYYHIVFLFDLFLFTFLKCTKKKEKSLCIFFEG